MGGLSASKVGHCVRLNYCEHFSGTICPARKYISYLFSYQTQASDSICLFLAFTCWDTRLGCLKSSSCELARWDKNDTNALNRRINMRRQIERISPAVTLLAQAKKTRSLDDVHLIVSPFTYSDWSALARHFQLPKYIQNIEARIWCSSVLVFLFSMCKFTWQYPPVFSELHPQGSSSAPLPLMCL